MVYLDTNILIYASIYQDATNYTKTMLQEAFVICLEDDKCTSINDILHLKIATQEATKLITYDKYFKSLQKYTPIEIVVL